MSTTLRLHTHILVKSYNDSFWKMNHRINLEDEIAFKINKLKTIHQVGAIHWSKANSHLPSPRGYLTHRRFKMKKTVLSGICWDNYWTTGLTINVAKKVWLKSVWNWRSSIRSSFNWRIGEYLHSSSFVFGLQKTLHEVYSGLQYLSSFIISSLMEPRLLLLLYRFCTRFRT